MLTNAETSYRMLTPFFVAPPRLEEGQRGEAARGGESVIRRHLDICHDANAFISTSSIAKRVTRIAQQHLWARGGVARMLLVT